MAGLSWGWRGNCHKVNDRILTPLELPLGGVAWSCVCSRSTIVWEPFAQGSAPPPTPAWGSWDFLPPREEGHCLSGSLASARTPSIEGSAGGFREGPAAKGEREDSETSMGPPRSPESSPDLCDPRPPGQTSSSSCPPRTLGGSQLIPLHHSAPGSHLCAHGSRSGLSTLLSAHAAPILEKPRGHFSWPAACPPRICFLFGTKLCLSPPSPHNPFIEFLIPTILELEAQSMKFMHR